MKLVVRDMNFLFFFTAVQLEGIFGIMIRSECFLENRMASILATGTKMFWSLDRFWETSHSVTQLFSLRIHF